MNQIFAFIFVSVFTLSGCSALIPEPPNRFTWDFISIEESYGACSESNAFVNADIALASPYILLGATSLVLGAPYSGIYFLALGSPFAYSAYLGKRKTSRCAEFKKYKQQQAFMTSEKNGSDIVKGELSELEQLRQQALISDAEYQKLKARLLQNSGD